MLRVLCLQMFCERCFVQYSRNCLLLKISRNTRAVGSGAVAAAATGCCTTALLAERLLRAVDDGVRRPSPPDTQPVGV